MKRFLDLDWAKVGKEMSSAAKLMRLSPTTANIYLYPYGHIEITDNGGEVNVAWSYIQGLELPIPDNVRVESFSLGFSIPYDVAGETEVKIGLKIKNAIDKAIADAISFRQYLYLPCSGIGEIRVIEFKPTSISVIDSGAGECSRSTERYLTQWKKEGTDRWKTHSLHEKLRAAIECALKLEKAQTSKGIINCCL